MIIDHLSSSQIKLYLQCPQKYQFQYVDLIPRAFRTSALVFGSAIHSALAWFHSSRLKGIKASEEKLCKIFETDWFSYSVDNDVRYLSGDDPMRLVVMGREMLSLYFREPQVEIKGSEVPFTIPLASPVDGRELGVNLEGFLDLVEADDTIVEFKTSSQVMNPFDIQTMLQLSAYGYAFRQLYKRHPKRFKVVNFVKNKKPKIEVTETTREDSDYEAFFSIAEQVLKSIRQSIFYPRTGFWCKDCEYRGICPMWQRGA